MTTTPAAHRAADALWYGGSRWALLLVPVAWLFALVTWLRRLAYRRGLLRSHGAGVAVVVVGNVSVGGTGKTPVVIWLVEALRERGYRPAIVSRGYGARVSGQPLRVGPQSDPRQVGDEPLLLARRTAAPVFVAADRVAAVAAAEAAGADIVVADDGLQHYRMRRDAEIAVVDGQRGLGNGWLLPAGPLRESAARLASVDHVLVNGAGFSPGRRFHLRPGAAVHLTTAEQRPLEAFADRQVYAVAGIGNPQRFYTVLRAAGLRVSEVPVPDHGRADIAALAREGTGQPVFMTEKDAVKYAVDEHPDAWYVPVHLEMDPTDEEAVLSDLTQRIERFTGLRRTCADE